MDDDQDLFWVAREGLKAPLPEHWKPCKTGDGEIYYFNFATGDSVWDHPCDEYYKKLYVEEKKKKQTQFASKQTKDKEKHAKGASAAAAKPVVKEKVRRQWAGTCHAHATRHTVCRHASHACRTCNDRSSRWAAVRQRHRRSGRPGSTYPPRSRGRRRTRCPALRFLAAASGRSGRS
jgi:hypothetical protein